MPKIKIQLDSQKLKDKLDLKDGYTPIKGKDYFDGQKGDKGEKGEKGLDAKPVDTSKIALEAQNKALEALLPKIPTIEQIEAKIPILDDRQKIVEKINKGKKDDLKIEAKQVSGLDKMHTDTLNRAVSILDQRTQFLINKIPTGGSSTDELVKLNASDPTAGYLDDKITGYGFLTAETDPVYTASSWFTTTNNASNWDTAYGWGNHASAGYLTVIPSHASSHAVGGADSVFPADPNADRYLKWNDTSGAIEWATVSSVSFGTTTQIPYMNAGGTDFLYSANLKYNGTTFTTNSITVSGLTSGRIPYITTDGLLTDGATLTYSATTNKVTNTPIATATGGITVVGSTYPYTGTSAIVVGNFTRYTDTGSGTVGPNMEGLNVDVRSRRNIDIDDGSETELTAVGLDIYASQTGNLSGDEGYFSNYVAGGTLDASITGTWTATGGIQQQNYGFQFATYESVVINNASLDVVDTNYGVQGIATNNSTITSANSATSTNIGGYFALASNGAWAGGAFQKIGYGLLIENNSADKFNTAWGIYISVNGGSNFLGGDNIETKFGTGYDASVYYDGANLIINPKSVGTGYLSILGTLYLGAQNIQTDTTTGMQIGTLGGASGQKLGFFAQTPIVQPVLATGSGATVDNVITVLQNLGLVRQS
jgi:hypothetical protein